MAKAVEKDSDLPWHRVKVYAPVGYTFGIVRNDMGVLELVLKAPGDEDWAHGEKPAGGVMEILPGHKSYSVLMG